MIEDILSKAERKVHNIMVDHHRKLVKVINRKLEGVEKEIGTHHPAASTTINTIHKKELEVMERQENSLRLALQRSRLRKTRTEHPAAPAGGSPSTTVVHPAGPSGENPSTTTTTGPPEGNHKITTSAPPQGKSPSGEKRRGKGKGKEKRKTKPYARPGSPPRDRLRRPGGGPGFHHRADLEPLITQLEPLMGHP